MLYKLDDTWIDILTGHAAARFKYVDVRSDVDFERQPPGWKVVHIPLKGLRAWAPQMLERSAEIVVYGSTDIETEAAQDALTQMGFDDLRAFEGGFDTLRAAGLV